MKPSKILSKKTLAPGVRRLEIFAPEIAMSARAGQFVIVRVHEKGERIPLTIVANNPQKRTITLIFREIGKTTRLLGALKRGDAPAGLTGPLGKPAGIEKFGRVAVIGGGLGVVACLPIVKALKERGNSVTCLIGAKNVGQVLLEKELRGLCDSLMTATDDGSTGARGTAGDLLEKLLNSGERFDRVFTAGPVPMMEKVCRITAGTKPPVRTSAILNPIMIDGTGLCGACRVSVWGKMQFACVDGPEFDGHGVDWEGLSARLKFFSVQERISDK